MSYSHNKRKKNNKQFKAKIAKTFEEFCAQRNANFITLSQDEYDLQRYYWLNYKAFYGMEYTIQEKAWLEHYRKKEGGKDDECR